MSINLCHGISPRLQGTSFLNLSNKILSGLHKIHIHKYDIYVVVATEKFIFNWLAIVLVMNRQQKYLCDAK